MATWSREKLEEVAGRRLASREKLGPVEAAALAFARWQGMTAEEGIDTDAEKKRLDAALDRLDEMDVGVWRDLLPLANELGEPVLTGLMRYSLGRGVNQVRAQAQTVEQLMRASGTLPDVAAAQADSSKPVPSKRKRKDRDR